MDKNALQKIALDEARQASGIRGVKLEQRGGTWEWDEVVYKDIFEAKFRIWKPLTTLDVELDPDTGEILSWFNREKFQKSGDRILNREEAIQIAKAQIENPDSPGSPEVINILKDGRPMVLVTWRLRARSMILEVMINPGIREVCGIRRVGRKND